MGGEGSGSQVCDQSNTIFGLEDEDQKDEVLLGRSGRWRSWGIEGDLGVQHQVRSTIGEKQETHSMVKPLPTAPFRNPRVQWLLIAIRVACRVVSMSCSLNVVTHCFGDVPFMACSSCSPGYLCYGLSAPVPGNGWFFWSCQLFHTQTRVSGAPFSVHATPSSLRSLPFLSALHGSVSLDTVSWALWTFLRVAFFAESSVAIVLSDLSHADFESEHRQKNCECVLKKNS